MADQIKQYGDHLYTRAGELGDAAFLPDVLYFDPNNGESSTPIISKQAIYLEAASSLLESPTPDPVFWTETAIRTAKEAALEAVKKILWTPGTVIGKKRADAPEIYFNVLNNLDAVFNDWKPELEETIRQNFTQTETAAN